MLRKVFFQLHWIIGITAGIVLAIVGLTGAVLSYETGIQNWLNRDVRFVTARDAVKLTPQALIDKFHAANPERRVQSVSLSNQPDVAAKLVLAPLPTTQTREEQGPPSRGQRGETKYFDPYTGVALEGRDDRGQYFFRNVRQLHRWLTWGEAGNQKVGKQIVGASTLLILVFGITGVYLRWPRKPLDWRAWFKLDFSLRGRSFLWHLHAVAAVWVLLFYVAMSLTGLYYSYDWYRNALYSMSGVTPPNAGQQRNEGEGRGQRNREREAGEQRPRQERAPIDLSTAWTAFLNATEKSGYSTATITLPRSPRDPVEFRYLDAKPAHERANNTLSVNATTGEIIKSDRYADKPAGGKFMASIFPLHSGSFFGAPGTMLYMLASLAMPLFAITGWMLYLDRRKKKYAARAAKSTVTTSTFGPESLLIGFASQTNFARQLAWQTAGAFSSAGVPVTVRPLETIDPSHLNASQRALFVVSTFGEGEPPDNARHFARRLMSNALPLPGLRFGLLSLGDKRYSTYCGFGRNVDEWLQKQGAKPLFPTVEVDSGDSQALHAWQSSIATLLPGSAVPVFREEPYTQWRLNVRRHLNAGSAGGAIFHLELQSETALSWQAGDIAEILPRNSSDLPKREFSIASLPVEGSLNLLIRLMERNGELGLGSGWLCHHAEVGTTIQLRIRSNPTFHAPIEDRPMILIGNGTGIAGLRAHLKARELAGRNDNWLIFGERNEARDFFYRDAILEWQQRGVLKKMNLAFSRDQSQRIYVQHLVRAASEEIRAWVANGAAFYICGGIEKMAPGVEQTLTDILGAETLERLQLEGRYRRDVY